MIVRLHPHAKERLAERGATEREIVETVRAGESFPVKYGRLGFRRNFSFDGEWRGRHFRTKQVEAWVIQEEAGWLVISFITRYF